MKNVLTTLLLIISMISYAQKLNWVETIGGTRDDIARSIHRTNNGEVIITGQYRGTADFDPKNTVSNITSNGGGDAYISKYDNLGNLVWTYTYGANGNDMARDLVADSVGNLYIIGWFIGTVDFNASPTQSFNLTSNGGEDAYVLSLDPMGQFRWAVSFGGIGPDLPSSIDYHPMGMILVGGRYSGTVDFDPSTAILNKSGTNGQNIFLSAFDLQGSLLWNNAIASPSGPSMASARIVKVSPANRILIGGSFFGTVNMDPNNPIPFNLTSSGTEDAFVAEYTSTGSLVNAIRWGSTSEDVVTSLAFDQQDNLFVAGYFYGQVDFDPSTNILQKNSNGSRDLFLSKLNTNYALQWNYASGSNSAEVFTSIATDEDGYVYGTGYHYGNFDADPDPNRTLNLNTNGGGDIPIFQFDSAGTLVNAYSFGSNTDDIGMDLMYIGGGRFLTTGMFSSTVDFDPTSVTNFITAAGQRDVYFKEVEFCKNSSDSLDAFGCSFYVSPGSKLFIQSGTYLDTILNQSGCDSVLTITVNLNQLNSTITQNGNALEVNALQNTSYQWLDCNNNNSPISGATSSSFTPSMSGDYAVVVRDGNCADTSNCVQVLITGIEDLKSAKKEIMIYPNPSSSVFTINGEGLHSAVVYDLKGQLIQRIDLENTNQFELEGEKGIYFLELHHMDGSRAQRKIVKN